MTCNGFPKTKYYVCFVTHERYLTIRIRYVQSKKVQQDQLCTSACSVLCKVLSEIRTAEAQFSKKILICTILCKTVQKWPLNGVFAIFENF